jgi:hypothetical protein
MQRQAGRIDSFIRDPESTGVVGVALPEEMPVSETIDLSRSLESEIGLELGLVVMNALYPERFSQRDADALEAARSLARSGPATEALEAALAQHARAEAQHEQLERLEQQVDPVLSLPHVFSPELAREDVESMSERLEAAL